MGVAIAALLAWSASALCGPGRAGADIDVSYSSGEDAQVFISSRGGGTNDLVVRFQRGAYRVADSSQRVVAGRGCDRISAHEARCRSRDKFDFVEAFLGAGDDSFVAHRSMPEGARVFGMKGNDRLIGSDEPYDDLIGGDQADVVKGGGGRDSVSGGGGERDRVYGGEGNDTVSVTGWPGGSGTGDMAFGGPGNDRIIAGEEREKLLDCGPGERDELSYSQGNESRIRGCEQIQTAEPLAAGLSRR